MFPQWDHVMISTIMKTKGQGFRSISPKDEAAKQKHDKQHCSYQCVYRNVLCRRWWTSKPIFWTVIIIRAPLKDVKFYITVNCNYGKVDGDCKYHATKMCLNNLSWVEKRTCKVTTEQRSKWGQLREVGGQPDVLATKIGDLKKSDQSLQYKYCKRWWHNFIH